MVGAGNGDWPGAATGIAVGVADSGIGDGAGGEVGAICCDVAVADGCSGVSLFPFVAIHPASAQTKKAHANSASRRERMRPNNAPPNKPAPITRRREEIKIAISVNIVLAKVECFNLQSNYRERLCIDKNENWLHLSC